METQTNKRCKACGESRDAATWYYKTPNGTSYAYCKECWSIDMRRRLLMRKTKESTISEQEASELQQIDQLYELRRNAGLQNPGDSRATPTDVGDAVTRQLQNFM